MTLKEIAQECNTSTGTVSRVLNGYTKQFSVSPELREKILKTAERVHYTPNPVYRGARLKEKKTISFLFRSFSLSSTYATTNDAVETAGKVLISRGYDFNYSFPSTVESIYYQMPLWKTGGLIIPNVMFPEELSQLGKNSGPVVVVNGVGNETCDTVNSDEHKNMYLIMKYLTSFGHQRIFYANYHPLSQKYSHYSIEARQKAYWQMCSDFNIPVLEGADLRISDVHELFSLIRSQNATAVIAYNHIVSQKLLFEAWKSGVRVPEDLSLICFNDWEMLAYAIPPLTCLCPPGVDMGKCAAEILINRIENPDEEPKRKNEMFTGKIIERESVCRI